MIDDRQVPGRRRRRWVVALAALSGGVAASLAPVAPAGAGAAVGYACSYRTNVSLFGGPATVRGCGQTIPPGNAGSASPEVSLGGPVQNDPDGARAAYGPAVIFGGHWAPDDTVPPSGALQASSSGSSTVTSSASAYTVGPSPFHADFVRGLCTASHSLKTYTVNLSNAVVETSTDAEGNPLTQEAVPNNPPVNHTVAFQLNHIGDHGIVVFNERILNPDGSTTLNAVHMYMQGPTAVGDMVIGQVRCGH